MLYESGRARCVVVVVEVPVGKISSMCCSMCVG